MAGIFRIKHSLVGLTILVVALLIFAPRVSAQTSEPANKEQVATATTGSGHLCPRNHSQRNHSHYLRVIAALPLA